MYTQKVINIFKYPRNAGGLHGANGIGKAIDNSCGDLIKIYLKVNEEGVIEEAKFKTFGCTASIASSSMICDMIKGLTIEEAQEITGGDVLEELGGLPVEKVQCCALAEESLHKAIEDYFKRLEKEQKKLEE